MTDPVNAPPTIIRDPELAAVLAELQRIRGACDRIEDRLADKPTPWTGLSEGKVEKGGHNVGPSQVVSRPPPPQSSIPHPDVWEGISRFYRSWWSR